MAHNGEILSQMINDVSDGNLIVIQDNRGEEVLSKSFSKLQRSDPICNQRLTSVYQTLTMNRFLPVFLVVIVALTLSGCGTKNVNEQQQSDLETTTTLSIFRANLACRSSTPESSLQWLSEIIIKAEEDRLDMRHKGNYLGKIMSTSYQGNPVIYIQMAMGSGGIHAYIFNCAGERVTIIPDDIPSFEQAAQSGNLIYTNLR